MWVIPMDFYIFLGTVRKETDQYVLDLGALCSAAEGGQKTGSYLSAKLH